MSPQQIAFGATNLNLQNTIWSDTCPANPICDQKTTRSSFRTFDGSCNNLRKSLWGKSRTQYQRCHQPVYFDGVGQPRKAASGRDLPRYNKWKLILYCYVSEFNSHSNWHQCSFDIHYHCNRRGHPSRNRHYLGGDSWAICGPRFNFYSIADYE